MSELLERAWPEATLNDVQRLRVIAAGLPGVGYAEGIVDASIERVWGLAGDLVHGTPQIELSVRSSEILESNGDHLVVRAQTYLGMPINFNVELRFGWCLMQSRNALVGMAAIEEEPGHSTRFAHFEGVNSWGRILAPFFRWNVMGDIKRISRILRRNQ